MPTLLRLAALAALLPHAAGAQDLTPLRCEVERATSFAAASGGWKEQAGQPGEAFSLVPILAPETCDAGGCSTYASGWVIVAEPASAGAYTCWTNSSPDAVTCDLMGAGQALVNLASRTALVMRYEGFAYGLPDSRVGVSLATCRPQG